MKAMVYKEYGTPKVLKIENIENPIPKKNEVLVKIIATTVTAGDWRMRKADPVAARLFNGLLKPKKVNILGFEISGVIESIGTEVTKFKIGDEIFAFCGFGFGGYAEYKCIAQDGPIAIKPKNISFEEAAAVPVGGITALRFLKSAKIIEAKNILIYGASGSVGTYAVQIAKSFNAKITAVCSTKNINMVKSIGADNVIDYTKENFTLQDKKFDIIFDAVGKTSKSKCKKILNKKGRYISVNGSEKLDNSEMSTLKGMLETGNLSVIIDKRFKFEDIPKAHEYVQAGHKVGNVIVNIY